MSNKIIKVIIDNFDAQHQLYIRMSELSTRQLQIMESGVEGNNEELNEILTSRQELLESISQLNLQNKELQKQAIREMKLEEFILSQIKPKIEQVQFQQLSEIVKRLGLILRAINEKDEKIENLMKLGLPQGVNKKKSSSQQASTAYRQAMKQSRQKPEKE